MHKVKVFLSKQTIQGRTICALIFSFPRSYQNLLRRCHHHLLLPTEQLRSTGNAVARNIGRYSIITWYLRQYTRYYD